MEKGNISQWGAKAVFLSVIFRVSMLGRADHSETFSLGDRQGCCPCLRIIVSRVMRLLVWCLAVGRCNHY